MNTYFAWTPPLKFLTLQISTLPFFKKSKFKAFIRSDTVN